MPRPRRNPTNPRRALIVWGGWEGHEPQRGAEVVGDMLADDGFRIEVTANLTRLGDPDIGEMDLVVPVVSGATVDAPVAEALTAAVRAGTGLAGYHAGLAGSFPGTPVFNYLAGVQYVAHPGDIVDFRVHIDMPQDPILMGIGDFDYRSEQYYLHYDPSVSILASTVFSGQHDPATAGVRMPVVIKRQFERGRIFYSALGHSIAEFEHPATRTILRRGLLWAARPARLAAVAKERRPGVAV